MGLHVCEVVNRTSDSRGEYVHIANDGPTALDVAGLKLTDYTTTQQVVHIYEFPAAQGGGPLTLGPGRSIYVFTGQGVNDRDRDGDLYLFIGRRAPIWNDDGDVAYLRLGDGRFLDSRTVGDPKRHPKGH